MGQFVGQYSTWLPDGRTLAYVPADPERFLMDDQPITRKQAEQAWNEQSKDWQRGRTLQQALDYWMGKS